MSNIVKNKQKMNDVLNKKIEILKKMLCIDTPIADPIEMLDTVIMTLMKVPYIPYPVSLSTVDMLPVVRKGDGSIFVLLGKKYKRTQYQFCGGFRDPKETSEFAANREFFEEATANFGLERFKYICSLFIDDERYKSSPHKITTNVFVIELTEEEAMTCKGGDDIELVKLFDVKELMENKDALIRPIHHQLFDILIKYLGL